jgi:protein-tyrosine phosphatase
VRFVDIHTHLIPEIDDGASSLLETLEMLRYAYDRGTRAMVATPHMFAAFGNLQPLPVYDAYVSMVKRLQKLSNGNDNGFLREMALYLGSENFISPEFLEALKSRDVLTLNGSRYLLVEFPPYLPFKAAESAIDKILESGLIPVLAHVERYSFLARKPARLAALKQKGCVAQVNAVSIVDLKGRGVTKAVLPFFENRLVDIVASDGHDVHSRPPSLDAAFGTLMSAYPQTAVAAWMWENPARILHDRPLIAGG